MTRVSDGDRLLTVQQVADMLHMSTSWVSKGAPHHDIPKIYLSPNAKRELRFKLSEVEAFVERQVAKSAGAGQCKSEPVRLAPVGRGRRAVA